MKACESCGERVKIGINHNKRSVLSRAVGLVFIYLPILTLPFVITSAYLTYYSLRMVGGDNVKKWSDFIPHRNSYRYHLENQIIMKPAFWWSLSQSKLFWVLNCSWYCPYSVALFEWHTYLVKVVENWWCPFGHDRKQHYTDGAIDQSFWHIFPAEREKLNPEDRNNPIFTQDPNENLDNY